MPDELGPAYKTTTSAEKLRGAIAVVTDPAFADDPSSPFSRGNVLRILVPGNQQTSPAGVNLGTSLSHIDTRDTPEGIYAAYDLYVSDDGKRLPWGSKLSGFMTYASTGPKARDVTGCGDPNNPLAGITELWVNGVKTISHNKTEYVPAEASKTGS